MCTSYNAVCLCIIVHKQEVEALTTVRGAFTTSMVATSPPAAATPASAASSSSASATRAHASNFFYIFDRVPSNILIQHPLNEYIRRLTHRMIDLNSMFNFERQHVMLYYTNSKWRQFLLHVCSKSIFRSGSDASYRDYTAIIHP